VTILIFFAIGWVPHSCAGDQEAEPQEIIAHETDSQSPSIEMLEFLGEWETEDGDWIDPTQIDNMTSSGQEQGDEEHENL